MGKLQHQIQLLEEKMNENNVFLVKQRKLLNQKMDTTSLVLLTIFGGFFVSLYLSRKKGLFNFFKFFFNYRFFSALFAK